MRRSSLEAAAGRGTAVRPARARARRALGPLGGLALDRHALRPDVAVPGQRRRRCRTCTDRAGAVPAGAGERPVADRRSSGTRRSSPRRRRVVGFALGGVVGFAIARRCSRSRACSSAASSPTSSPRQTIPLLAIAPMVVDRARHEGRSLRTGSRSRCSPRTSPSSRSRSTPCAASQSADPRARRADALLRRRPLGDPLEAARARPRCRTSSRRSGSRRRSRSSARSSPSPPPSHPGRARRRDRQLQPVLLDRAAGALGDEHHRGARSGSSFFLAVVLVEKLVVRRAPEHVA